MMDNGIEERVGETLQAMVKATHLGEGHFDNKPGVLSIMDGSPITELGLGRLITYQS